MASENRVKTEYALSEDFKKIFDEQIGLLRTEKSKANYKAIVNEICAYSNKDFLNLKRPDVEKYFDFIADRSQTTKVMKFSVLRSVAKYVDSVMGTQHSLNFLDIAQAQRMDMTYEVKDLPSSESIDRVIEWLSTKNPISEKDTELLAMIQLSLETGLTTKSICDLKYENMKVDDPSGIPLIHYEPEVISEDDSGKKVMSVPRNIPVSADLATKINTIGSRNKKRKDLPYIFRNAHGDRLGDRTAEINLRNACIEAGLDLSKEEGFTFQDLRVLAAAHMKAGGASDEALARQLGTTSFWFSRLNNVAQELKKAAGSLSHLKVEY